jgi:hypothetical protein
MLYAQQELPLKKELLLVAGLLFCMPLRNLPSLQVLILIRTLELISSEMLARSQPRLFVQTLDLKVQS